MSGEPTTIRQLFARWLLGIETAGRELVRPGTDAASTALAADRDAKPTRDLDRLWAAAAHLALFVGFPIVVPLGVYLLHRRGSAFVRWHSFQSLVLAIWTICMTVLTSVLVGVALVLFLLLREIGMRKLGLALFGISTLPLVLVLVYSVVASAIGGIKSLAGVPWTMPIIGRIASGLIARRKATPELPDAVG